MRATAMELRKCPSCKDQVGAESVVCPRCGVNFRAALVRKIILRGGALMLVIWLLYHFAPKVF